MIEYKHRVFLEVPIVSYLCMFVHIHVYMLISIDVCMYIYIQVYLLTDLFTDSEEYQNVYLLQICKYVSLFMVYVNITTACFLGKHVFHEQK